MRRLLLSANDNTFFHAFSTLMQTEVLQPQNGMLPRIATCSHDCATLFNYTVLSTLHYFLVVDCLTVHFLISFCFDALPFSKLACSCFFIRVNCESRWIDHR